MKFHLFRYEGLWLGQVALACMTFGLGAARAEAPSFVDRTEALGLELDELDREAACWVDFDNDGWPDLIVSGRVYINQQGQGFTRTITGVGRVVAADFDNDGWVDLFSYSQRKLYRNVNGTAVEEVPMPPFPDPYHSQSAAWGDFTGNGFVDLYVGGYEHWDNGVTYPDLLFINVGGTHFELVWSENTEWYRARSVTTCDFNRDGHLDIYVSNYRLMQNRLWLNDGAGGLTDVAGDYGAHGGGSPEGLWASAHTIGSLWADFNNDGEFDLFVGNFAHPWDHQPESRFLRNRGLADGYTFQDMGTGGIFYQESYASPVAGDLNNNGKVDLLLTTIYSNASYGVKNYPALFQNTGGFNVADITATAGLAELPSTYQAALADYNRNGQLDLVTAGRIFENQGNTSNRYLTVTLRGDGQRVNRSAIGAQARIRLGKETWSRQVESGTGRGNQNELMLHFGLGQYEGPVDVEVFWPDGRTQWVEGIAPTQTWIEVHRTRLEVPYAQDFEAGFSGQRAASLPGWTARALHRSVIASHTPDYSYTFPLPGNDRERVLSVRPDQLDFLQADFAMTNATYEQLYVDQLVRFEPFTVGATVDEDDTEVKLGFYLDEASRLMVYHGGSDGDTATHSPVIESIETGRWYRLTIALDMESAAVPDGDEVIPFFQARLDGVPLSHAQHGYASPSAHTADYHGGSWFRSMHYSVQRVAGTERRIQWLRLNGSGMIDELHVTESEPAFVYHRIRTVLGPNGTMDPPGVPVDDPFPSHEIEVPEGAAISIVYTADTWHVIGELLSDGVPMTNAVDAHAYTWQWAMVNGDISNRVTFAEEIWTGDNRSPLWWADARGYSDGAALSIYDGYLLNQTDLDRPFQITELGVDSVQRPYVRWHGSGLPHVPMTGVGGTNLLVLHPWADLSGQLRHENGTNTWVAMDALPLSGGYFLRVHGAE